mgnify:CR=1 FL=1
MKTYAGIGSRKTPFEVLDKMKNMALALQNVDYILRSGGARGADSAFESGAGDKKEIFTADDATPEAMILTSKYHPNWNACKPYVKKLHARNAMIVLGKNLDKLVDFIICWTPGGTGSGGTGQALRIAKAYGIPIYDLGSK